MTALLTREQVAAAKTAELLAFYNEQTGQAVARFADRKTAERRVLAVMDQLDAAAAAIAAAHEGAVAPAAAPQTLSAAAARRESARAGRCPECGESNDINAGRVSERAGRQEVVEEHVCYCHSCGHTFNVNTGRPAQFRGRVGANRSAAQAASWTDPEVRAARCTRTAVTVRKAGTRDAMHFKSVAEAFRQLALPMSKHIKFRMDLKAIGTAKFGDYHFTAEQ